MTNRATCSRNNYEIDRDEDYIFVSRLDDVGLKIKVDSDGNVSEVSAVIGPDFANRVIVNDELRLDMAPKKLLQLEMKAMRHVGMAAQPSTKDMIRNLEAHLQKFI